jgi:hypothetical protein
MCAASAKFAVALATALAGCSDSGLDGNRVNDVQVEQSFEFRFDAGAATLVGVETLNGSIVVTAGPSASEIVIDGIRRVASDSEQDAREFLDRVIVEISEPGTEVWARTSQPNDTEGREVVVSYSVTLPPWLELVAHTVNGAITITGTESDVEARSVNGGLAGTVSLRPGGEVVFTTVNGGILLNVPPTTSATVSADVVNGAITVAGLTLTDGFASTTSVRGQLGSGDGSIVLETTNGGIALNGRVPGGE